MQRMGNLTSGAGGVLLDVVPLLDEGVLARRGAREATWDRQSHGGRTQRRDEARCGAEELALKEHVVGWCLRGVVAAVMMS